MKKLFNRKGFTLLETLIAVAVVVVLTGMAVPAIVNTNASLTAQQENDYAKSIFLAAQDNLTNMKTNGSLNALSDETDAVSVYTEALDVDNNKTYTVKDGIVDEEHADELRNNDTEHQYVVITNSDNGFDKVLPSTSIDSSILNRAITIVFNPVSGDIYCVKYGDKGEYYGSVSTLDNSKIIITPVVRLLNGEENIVSIKFPLTDELSSEYGTTGAVNALNEIMGDTKFVITVTDSSGNYFTYNLGSSGLDINQPTFTASWVLDSLVSGHSFSERYSSKNCAEKSTTAVIAGSDVTVTVSFSINDSSSYYNKVDFNTDTTTYKAVGNSLFDNHSFSKGYENTIVVSNGRQLQNLNNISTSLAATLAKTEGAKIVLGADILWGDTQDYYGKYKETEKFLLPNGKTDKITSYLDYLNFVPIDGSKYFKNGSKITFDGKGKSIRDLQINTYSYDETESTDTALDAGLFSNLMFSAQNITFIDPVIKGGSNVGVLAATCGTSGSDTGITITNCKVVIENGNTSYDTILDSDGNVDSNADIYGVYSVKNNNYVGLLLGAGFNITVNGCTDVDDNIVNTVDTGDSFIPASGKNLGLVIGYAENCIIKNVKATGDIRIGQANCVGIIAGVTKGTTSVTNSFAYGTIINVKSDCVGGAIGLSEGGTFDSVKAYVDISSTSNLTKDFYTTYSSSYDIPNKKNNNVNFVGKFIGCINKGSFTGCYGGVQKDNNNYQFLGAAKFSSTTLQEKYPKMFDGTDGAYYSSSILDSSNTGVKATRDGKGQVNFTASNEMKFSPIENIKDITICTYPDIVLKEDGNNRYTNGEGTENVLQYIADDPYYCYKRTAFDNMYRLNKTNLDDIPYTTENNVTTSDTFIIYGNGLLLSAVKERINASDINSSGLYRDKWPDDTISWFRLVTKTSTLSGYKYGLWDSYYSWDKDPFSYYYSESGNNPGEMDKPFIPNLDSSGNIEANSNIYRYNVYTTAVNLPSNNKISESDFDEIYSDGQWQWRVYDKDDSEGFLKFAGDTPYSYVFLNVDNIDEDNQEKIHLLPDGLEWVKYFGQDQENSPTVLNYEYEKSNNRTLIRRYQRNVSSDISIPRQASFVMTENTPTLATRARYDSWSDWVRGKNELKFGSEFYVDIYKITVPTFEGTFNHVLTEISYHIDSDPKSTSK